MKNLLYALVTLFFWQTVNASEVHATSQSASSSDKKEVIIPRARCSHYFAKATEEADPVVKLSWEVLPRISTIFRALIYHETKGIDAAFFRFNHDEIAQTWIDTLTLAPQRFESSLILDEGEDTSLKRTPCGNLIYNNGAIGQLIDEGVKVYQLKKNRDGTTDNRSLPWKREIMHHKFLLFKSNSLSGGQPLVVTGSYNATRNADDYNWENIVILDDVKAIKHFQDELAQLNASEPELLEEIDNDESNLGDLGSFGEATPQEIKEAFMQYGTFRLAPSIRGQKVGFQGTDSQNYCNIPYLIKKMLAMKKITHMYAALERCNWKKIADYIPKDSGIKSIIVVNEKGSECKELSNIGIEIREVKKKSDSGFASETMHDKFVLLYGPDNQQWLITSSGHPNSNANPLSWEATILLEDQKIIALFKKEFDLLTSDEHSTQVFQSSSTASSSSSIPRKRKTHGQS